MAERRMAERKVLTLEERTDLWDAVLVTVRGYFQREGLREVSTPVRVEANAVEPFIEPFPAGPWQLQTSPELAMKRILGTRSIYQIAHCFRGGEWGPQHREEFHLIEWYRVERDLAALTRDIEVLLQAAANAASVALGEPCPAPRRWRRIGWLDLFETQMAVTLRGDEEAGELQEPLAVLRGELGLEAPRIAHEDAEVAQLAAWVELFSLWSDARLDPWLLENSVQDGVHLVGFPKPLAALSRVQGPLALRFESYFRGAELANAYNELRDAREQTLRFRTVNRMRERLGQAPLPICSHFLEHLRALRLPECVGAAMGLERLISSVCCRAHLSEIEVCDGFAGAPVCS